MIPKRFLQYYGDETRWFTGTVVDLLDPKQLGRIQVRIFGIHSDNKTDIPDKDLPWAQIIMPITQGGNSGLGNNLGIQVESLVFGFFLDGTNSQLPMVLGSIPRLEEDEPSTNQLARGTQTNSYTIDEKACDPADPYAAEYPHNKVYETTSGHIKEYDDTPEAERIREIHGPSGTFWQMHPDGSYTLHVNNNKHVRIDGNECLHITGSWNIYVDAAVNLTTPLLTLNGNLHVTGDVTTEAGVSLNNHTHTDTPGLGGGITTPPNKG